MNSPTGDPDGGLPQLRRRQPLSPERVRNAEFGRTPLGRRGYNEDEVRLFLSRVAEDIAASDAEKAALRAEITRLRNYYREHRIDVDEHAAATGAQPSLAAINLMSQAQQAADAQVAQAEQYCRSLVQQARAHYEDILRDAAEQANQAAAQLDTVYGVPDHAGGVEREALERRITWLRTFAEVTQVQLRSVLEALTREVDKLGDLPEPSAPSAPSVPVDAYQWQG